MSSREVLVKDLALYIGREVSFTFSDGWEEWPITGILLGLDKPEDFHLTYISTCSCGSARCDKKPLSHGAVAMGENDVVRVNTGGRKP